MRTKLLPGLFLWVCSCAHLPTGEWKSVQNDLARVYLRWERAQNAGVGRYAADRLMKAEALLHEANERLHGGSGIGLHLLRPDVLVKEAVKEAKSQITAEDAQKARYSINQAETLIAEAERMAAQISLREELFLVPYKRTSRPSTPPPLDLGDAPEALDYRVREGDTLWDISSHPKFYGNPWKWNVIYDANRRQIRNPHRIYPGQKIQIPLKPMPSRPGPEEPDEKR